MTQSRLMTILEIAHVRDGRVVWQARDLPNTLHFKGEELLLKAIFEAAVLSPTLYFGMDARPTPANNNVMSDLRGEPTGAGYLRVGVLRGSGKFTTEENASGHYRSLTEIMTFTASVSDWGPVTNLFATDHADNSGVLIATAPLGQAITVIAGDSILVRMGLTLFGV